MLHIFPFIFLKRGLTIFMVTTNPGTVQVTGKQMHFSEIGNICNIFNCFFLTPCCQ